jgi:hypothetical protein
MRNAKISTKKSASHSAETTAQAAVRPFPSLAEMGQRAAAAAGLKRGGFVDDARRAATPYVVDCKGLARDNLGEEPFRFEYELQVRRAWCDENGGLFEIEPLRDDSGFLIRASGARTSRAALSVATRALPRSRRMMAGAETLAFSASFSCDHPRLSLSTRTCCAKFGRRGRPVRRRSSAVQSLVSRATVPLPRASSS